MLLASRAGSMGTVSPSFRSPNWRTRSTGQARGWPWGADQAQQPHAVVVWASADPCDGINGNRPCERTLLILWLRMSFASDGDAVAAASGSGGRPLVFLRPPASADRDG